MSENITPPPAPTPATAPETFSKDYVRELREENKGWRLKAHEQEQAAKSAAEAAQKAVDESAAKVAEAHTSATQRVIRAEMKAAAIKAGLVDLDALQMLDLSSVKLDENGEVTGADDVLAAAKKAKPYLFGDAKTSSTQQPPKPAEMKPKKVSEMSEAEKAAARERIRRGLPPV